MIGFLFRILYAVIANFGGIFFLQYFELIKIQPMVSTYIVTTVVLVILMVFIKPILRLVTLPLNVLTLGLFTLVNYALLVWFASSVVEGLTIDMGMNFALATFFLAAINSAHHVFAKH